MKASMIWLVRFGAVMHSIKSTQLQIINETFLVFSYINKKKKKTWQFFEVMSDRSTGKLNEIKLRT